MSETFEPQNLRELASTQGRQARRSGNGGMPTSVSAPGMPTPSRLIEIMVRGLDAEERYKAAGRELVAFLETLGNPNNPGPDAEPHLGLRVRRGKRGKISMIVIVHGKRRQTTGVRAKPGEDYRKNRFALAKLADYNFKRLMGVFTEYSADEVTLGDVMDEWLRDHEPKTAAMEEAYGARYDAMSEYAEQLGELLETRAMKDFDQSIGFEYANFRTSKQIKTQSPKHENPTTASLQTAVIHLKALRQFLRYYADQHGTPVKTFRMPPKVNRGKRWLNWYELVRLLLACRGWLFDSDGNLIRDLVTLPDGSTKWVARRLLAEERAELEIVERFILLYFYGGTRFLRNLQIKWGQTADFGFIDLVNDMIVRAGQTSRLTNKRAEPSRLIGSLVRMVRKWAKKDALNGHKFVLHDADGKPISTRMRGLFNKVAANAGLPWVKPHFLKHSGVTLCCYAGMGLPAISDAFSTTTKTLLETYTHLSTFWAQGNTRPYDPKNLCLLALKRVSPIPEGFVRIGGALMD